MLIKKVIPALILFAFVIGCSTTVSLWHGEKIYTGTGGTKRVVKSIDIWENGSPNRQFKVLAIISAETSVPAEAAAVMNSITATSRIIKEAENLGADAIVPLSIIGITDRGGSLKRRVAAIKYIK